MSEALRRKRGLPFRLLVTAAATLFVVPAEATASPSMNQSLASCTSLLGPSAASIRGGRPYLQLAFANLARDRLRYAGLAAQRPSSALNVVAEAHSLYMTSIGSWSDGDPAGWILTRVRAAGVDATYAGQNVVTANGATVADAIQHGEAFFAREASGGGPHWDNITNPNHRFVGLGLSLLGQPGNYTIYLTQVFADAGGCTPATGITYTAAVATSPAIRAGAILRPAVDTLQLRSEPGGMVIQALRTTDRLKVITVKAAWAQVEVLRAQLYGWVYVPMLTAR